MWYLIEIGTIYNDKVDCIELEFSPYSLVTKLDYLIYKNYKSGECKRIQFNNKIKAKLLYTTKVIDYIAKQLGDRNFLGLNGEYLYTINIWEHKLIDYFDEVNLVSRYKNTNDYYNSCIGYYNLLILIYNFSAISVMKLLLTHPDAFVFEEDAFYFELAGSNTAFKYEYLRGRKKLLATITKFRIAGYY